DRLLKPTDVKSIEVTCQVNCIGHVICAIRIKKEWRVTRCVACGFDVVKVDLSTSTDLQLEGFVTLADEFSQFCRSFTRCVSEWNWADVDAYRIRCRTEG